MLFTDEQVTLTRRYADTIFKNHGVVRKYTGDDYITHCDEIIDILDQYDLDTNHMKIVAYLHDIVEDTPTDHHDIWINYGQLIATDVYWLTNTKDEQLTRQERHAKDVERFSKNAPYWIHNLKLADLISNARSIREHDPKFAIVFAREAKELMEVLVEHGHPGLYCDLDDELDKIFEEYHERIQAEKERKLDIFYVEPEETLRKTLMKIAVNIDVKMMDMCRRKQLPLTGIKGNIFVKHHEPSLVVFDTEDFALAMTKAFVRAFDHFHPDMDSAVTLHDTRVYVTNPLLVNTTGQQLVLCYKKSLLHPFQYIHLPISTVGKWVTTKDIKGITPHWQFTLVDDKTIDQLILGLQELFFVTPSTIPHHIVEKFCANDNTINSIYRLDAPRPGE